MLYRHCFRVCSQVGSGKLGWFEIKNTNQLLVYADDVNILGGSVRNAYKNTETLVFEIKAIGLEVIADKTKYMVM